MNNPFNVYQNSNFCLENDVLVLHPLAPTHFDALFLAASDPLNWEQHPNPNRYQIADFTNFFNGAIASEGAFLIVEKASNAVVGSSRFYNYDAEQKTVLIGYTFIAREFWGRRINAQIKKIMMDYAFHHVNKILFQIGSLNIRSQIAMERLGGKKIGEELVEYFGESPKMNFVYEILKNK